MVSLFLEKLSDSSLDRNCYLYLLVTVSIMQSAIPPPCCKQAFTSQTTLSTSYSATGSNKRTNETLWFQLSLNSESLQACDSNYIMSVRYRVFHLKVRCWHSGHVHVGSGILL